MNLLMITKNLDILKEDSPIHRDMLEYGSVVDNLYVVVLNSDPLYIEPKRLSKTMWLFGTNALHPLFTPFDCAELVRREMFFKRMFYADLVLACDAYESGLAALLIHREHQTPYHLHIESKIARRDRSMAAASEFLRMAVAWCAIRYAAAIRATSQRTYDSVLRLRPRARERLLLLPRLVESGELASEELSLDLHKEHPKFTFIMLATTRGKNATHLDIALGTLKAALRLQPKAALVVLGEWSFSARNRVYSAARKHGVRDHVFFESKFDRLTSYFKTADLYLMCEEEDPEGWIEIAAGCGCPVICPPVGKAPNIIVDGNSGFLCDLSDPSCFSRHTYDVIHNPGLGERVKLNAAPFMQSATDASRADLLKKVIAEWQRTLNEHAPRAPARGSLADVPILPSEV